MGAVKSAVAGGLRTGAGLVLGAVASVGHVALLVAAAVGAAVPAAGPLVASSARRVLAAEAMRMSTFHGLPSSGADLPTTPRILRHMAARVPVGLLGGAVVVLLVLGVLFAATVLWSWITGTPWVLEPDVVVTGTVIAYYTLPGAVLCYLALAGAAGIVRAERALLRDLLAPSREELERRVTVLAESRDAVVAAVDDERRRIERDLHDGVQQRVVALGMLLGRARRHPDHAERLVEQAHEEAQRVLVELRDVSWRVYPAALDTGGLAAALESVAERAPLPVHLACELPVEPPVEVRAAAWFVVSEAVTNAAKHSGAGSVTVRVGCAAGRLRASVCDDGRGGADPAGGGLAGLARRVAAVDGRFTVSSPPGGPTTVVAELPCG